MTVGLLERLGFPAGHATKIIDGYHPVEASGDDQRVKPDLLPLNEGDNGKAPCNRNVLVAISGDDLDTELVTLACQLSAAKKGNVYAVFGIEVPRKLPIDAEMPGETDDAHRALQHASDVAARLRIHVETEIVQSRSFGQSLVDEAEAHECALVILGLPFQQGVSGHFELGETAEYVLKNAPGRVWMVRGPRPQRSADHDEHAERSERLEGIGVGK
jgi:nucleotide-binding universal stress UspA family protein